MFIFLLYFLFSMKLVSNTMVVQEAGLYEIEHDDIAMILFLTVENTFDYKMPVSVDSIECIEGDPYLETANHMYLLGGDMGYIDRKHVKNLTLIYPNLYLRNRVGKCLISLHFRTEECLQEMRTEVYFDSNRAYISGGDEQESCRTCDLSSVEDCTPVDCVIKYSSRRSFFNKERKLCQAVPQCPPTAVYLPKSNICRQLHEPVCKSDLEMIEDGQVEQCHSVTNMVNYICHHGITDNRTGECVCLNGWSTSTCTENAYHPTLNLYHMCNIELNTWEKANRKKLLMTILVLTILAIALAAKMLLAVCLLNWCCQFLRSKSKNEIDDDFCGAYNCPAAYQYCGDPNCFPGNEETHQKSSRTIKVSFSNIDAVSTAEDTDVTVSADEDKSKRKINKSSSSCHCGR